MRGITSVAKKAFTFQYVSIISSPLKNLIFSTTLFTFQYVSIISIKPNEARRKLDNLHSNMFLLFPFMVFYNLIRCLYLHSNMFLLFLFFPNFISIYNPIYIPICFYYFKIYPQSVTTQIRFTFQYVSIISRCRIQAGRVSDIFTFQYVSIISIRPAQHPKYISQFTFQYVSIISKPLG